MERVGASADIASAIPNALEIASAAPKTPGWVFTNSNEARRLAARLFPASAH